MAHIIVILLVVLGGISYGGYRVYTSKNKKPATQNTVQTTEAPKEQPKAKEPKTPEGFVEYKNEEVGFKFVYPKAWGDVTLSKGLLDQQHEEGSGYRMSFKSESKVTIAVQSKDWKYTGSPREGIVIAFGFNKYEPYKAYNEEQHYSRLLIDKNDFQVLEDISFSYGGVLTVDAHKKFIKNKTYSGIQMLYADSVYGYEDGKSSIQQTIEKYKENPEPFLSNDKRLEITTVAEALQEL